MKYAFAFIALLAAATASVHRDNRQNRTAGISLIQLTEEGMQCCDCARARLQDPDADPEDPAPTDPCGNTLPCCPKAPVLPCAKHKSIALQPGCVQKPLKDMWVDPDIVQEAKRAYVAPPKPEMVTPRVIEEECPTCGEYHTTETKTYTCEQYKAVLNGLLKKGTVQQATVDKMLADLKTTGSA